MDRREDAIFVLIEQERLLLFGLLPEGSQVLAVLGPDGGQATDVGFRAVDPTVVWPSSSRGRLVMVSGRRGGSGFNTMWPLSVWWKRQAKEQMYEELVWLDLNAQNEESFAGWVIPFD